MTGDGALSALLSRLLIAFTIEFDNEFEHHMPHRTALVDEAGPEPRVSSSGKPMRRVWLVSQAMWSNGMRFIPPDGVPLRSLEGLGANLGGLQRWGSLRAEPHGQPRARQLVRPTRAGRYAKAIWERLEGAIERRWSERFAADLVAELRAALVDAIGQPDRNLPLYLPMVQYADGMRTAVVSPTNEQLSTAKAAGDPADLGLSVLLSRALLLVTLDYERESPLSLPISADLLPAIGTGGVRFRDLPLRAGVSKEAVSAAAGFLQRAGFAVQAADATRGQAITLTDRGIAALHAHEALLGAAEERWVDRCGAEQIARLHGCVRQLAEQRTSEGQPALSLGLRP
ncbi:MAG: hypothetical protein ACTHJW_13125 [Streptosporangiaceae bacterium]